MSNNSPSHSSFTDRQLCAISQNWPTTSGLHFSIDGRQRERRMRTPLGNEGRLEKVDEGQDIEGGSDSDSGKGTVFSDCLDTPTRDCQSAFETGVAMFERDLPENNGSSSTSQPVHQPAENGHARIIEKRRSEDSVESGRWGAGDVDDGIASPTSDSIYNGSGLESPLHPTGVSQDFRSPIASKFPFPDQIAVSNGYQGYHVTSTPVKLHENRKFASTDGFEGEEDSTPQQSYLRFQDPLDKNNNAYECTSPSFEDTDHQLVKESGRRSEQSIELTPVRPRSEYHHSYSYNGPYGRNDSFEPREQYVPGSPNPIDLIKDKCQRFFGSQAAITTYNRPVLPRQGWLASVPHSDAYDYWDDSRTVIDSHADRGGYSPGACYHASIPDFADMPNYTTGHDCSNDRIDSPGDVHYAYHLTLSDSLSTVRPDGPSQEQYERHYKRHMGYGIPGTPQRNSPSKGNRYARRYQETAFKSLTGSDPQLFPEGSGYMTPLREFTPADYRRIRSISHEQQRQGVAIGRRGVDSPVTVLSPHPAMQQPFHDDSPATLPRPSKPKTHVSAAEQVYSTPSHSPTKMGRPRRRWTNQGLSEASSTNQLDQVDSGSKFSRSSSRLGSLFSLLKGSRHASSASVASKDTGLDAGAPGDISLQSMDRGSLPYISGSLGNHGNARKERSYPSNGPVLRSISTPEQEGRRRSSGGMTLLERFRSRLTMKKKQPAEKEVDLKAGISTSGENAAAQTSSLAQKHQSVELQSSASWPNGDRVNGDTRGSTPHASGLPQFPREREESDRQTTTFHTLPQRKLNEFPLRQDAKASPKIRSSSCSGAAVAAAAPSASQRYKEVSEVSDEVEEFKVQVLTTATSTSDSDERTITEEDFSRRKQRTISALNEFVDRCKHMVIRSPASRDGFLEELKDCRRHLGVLVNCYRHLVSCTSLPADKVKVADRVVAVLDAFRETVMAAADVTGGSAKHPKMRELRLRTNQLVTHLAGLMKTIREMDYNRLSRRF